MMFCTDLVWWCSYSRAMISLQMCMFGSFYRCLGFTVVLAFCGFLTPFLFLLVTTPMRKKDGWSSFFQFRTTMYTTSISKKMEAVSISYNVKSLLLSQRSFFLETSTPFTWRHIFTFYQILQLFLLFLEQFLKRAPEASFVLLATPLAEGSVAVFLRPTSPLRLIPPWLEPRVLAGLNTVYLFVIWLNHDGHECNLLKGFEFCCIFRRACLCLKGAVKKFRLIAVMP